MKDATIHSQSYAIDIEHTMAKVFSCDRFGIGGIVNSDYIRKRPISAIIHTLTFIYSNSDVSKKQEIEDFIDNLLYYEDWSIDTILSFSSNEKNIDGITYSISCDNGEQELKSIIKDFEEIIR